MKKLIEHISQITHRNFTEVKSVSGGSISSAFVLRTYDLSYFLKVNAQSDAHEMFVAEQTGLKAIEETKSIAVPKVHHVDRFEGKAFLLMDFVESKSANATDFKTLGAQLAKLHLNHNDNFGYGSNNFIGSLPQSNNLHTSWAEFYWHERIFPQLKLAAQKQLLKANEIIAEKTAITVFEELLGKEIKPSLLHGDLWTGNYLIATDGTPHLIDPAVYYGHSMVDIAMSKLFGGFGPEFYNSYHNVIPKSSNYEAQINLYQLYFLLVHLNLFGKSYYGSVSSILKQYF